MSLTERAVAQILRMILEGGNSPSEIKDLTEAIVNLQAGTKPVEGFSQCSGG